MPLSRYEVHHSTSDGEIKGKRGGNYGRIREGWEVQAPRGQEGGGDGTDASVLRRESFSGFGEGDRQAKTGEVIGAFGRAFVVIRRGFLMEGENRKAPAEGRKIQLQGLLPECQTA